MASIDIQPLPCSKNSTAVEDIAVADMSDEDYSSDSSGEDHDSLKDPPKKRPLILSKDDDISDKDDMHDCPTDVGTDPLEIKISGNENINDTKEESGSVPASARCSKSLEKSKADHLFKRFNKCMDHLMSFHLSGKPSSFRAYLTSLVQDPSDFIERVEMHSSPAKALSYKDHHTRAFLAEASPPIRVGSLTNTHVTRANFKCAICIPYLRWAIQNDQLQSVFFS